MIIYHTLTQTTFDIIKLFLNMLANLKSFSVSCLSGSTLLFYNLKRYATITKKNYNNASKISCAVGMKEQGGEPAYTLCSKIIVTNSINFVTNFHL